MRHTSRVLVAVLVATAAFVAAFALAAPSRADTIVCGKEGYSYAGAQNAGGARGVVAALTTVAAPQVQNGHVAAWVGVGGAGAGPGGTDEWMQVGVATFADGQSMIYTEVTEPGAGPKFTAYRTSGIAGERHQMAVVELPGNEEMWQVWVDGRWIGQPVHLPGSDAAWAPIATVESYDGGKPVCNRFRYRFDALEVATSYGVWEQFEAGEVFQDPGYQVIPRPTGFLARAAGY